MSTWWPLFVVESQAPTIVIVWFDVVSKLFVVPPEFDAKPQEFHELPSVLPTLAPPWTVTEPSSPTCAVPPAPVVLIAIRPRMVYVNVLFLTRNTPPSPTVPPRVLPSTATAKFSAGAPAAPVV